ncbi:AAA family ATPase [Streptomyces sp. NPDC005963]|uniref:AAA family ATPase n=1 Tax=Streptomyces sp. NPDC005963 TaxID=3156721 RepID=UPI00340D483F
MVGKLVWVNGPFGGGKTQTAWEIHRRLPGSFVCDPERVGFGLHGMMPPALRDDFQDLAAWRQGVFEALDVSLRSHPGVLIAPMTLVEPAYFEEIVGRLRAAGHDVHHFALLAERETVLRRLRERGLGTGLKRESFAVRKLDHCLDRLGGPLFAEHVHTDRVSVPQVADLIADRAGLLLRPNNDGPLTHRLRKAWRGIRHIRLG